MAASWWSALPAPSSAIAKAATSRDREALLIAAQKAVAEARIPQRRVTTSPFTPGQLGAALLVGVAPSWAEALRKRLCTYVGKDERLTPIADIPLEQMHVIAQYKLFEIKLLSGDWSELPKGRGTPSTWMRAALRRQRNFFAAYSAHDPKKLAAAIAAIARADPAHFGLLAYALYHIAQQNGIAVSIPRKYNF